MTLGLMLMIKLACLGLIWVLPIVVPFRPSWSIRCPVDTLLVWMVGFLKVQPAEEKGCV